MKRIIAIFYFLSIFYCNSTAQEYEIVTHKEFSQNKNYRIELTGRVHDDFYGECRYVFFNAGGKLFWDKSMTYQGIPKVSNRGDIAIFFANRIAFFDSTGNEKGSFKKTIYPYKACDELEWLPSAHNFSSDGKFYYLFSGSLSSDTTILYCLSNKGEELWKTELSDYCPCNVQTLNDLILVDDFCWATTDVTNSLLLLKINSGEEIERIYVKSVNPSVKHLIIEGNNFILYNQGFKLFNTNGEFLKDLGEQEIRDFIISSKNEDKIIAGLDYFYRYGNINLLASDSTFLCELLDCNINYPMKWMINSINEKLEISCDER